MTALLNDIPALTDILLHHVVGDSVMSGMLSNNQIVTTLLGTDVTVTINSNGDVYIDNAMVTVVDLVGDNGVVHVIDAVMIPVTSSNNVYDIISASPSHTTLNTAVMACSLMEHCLDLDHLQYLLLQIMHLIIYQLEQLRHY